MSDVSGQPVGFISPPDDSEEIARAEVYGLLASLFIAAPSVDLYAQLRVAVTEAPSAGAFLETNWSEVVATSRRLTLDSIQAEYAALFGGVGKPEICEVMRYLIAGEDLAVSNLASQQRFFNAHLRPWVERLCDTVAAHPKADFYCAVAGFARDFFAVEAQGFDLLDA